MFQCIIQQRNGWIHVPNQEFRDVFPGKVLSQRKVYDVKFRCYKVAIRHLALIKIILGIF